MDQQRYSIDQFVQKTLQQDKGQGVFEMETDRILEVNLQSSIWTKAGSRGFHSRLPGTGRGSGSSHL